MHGFQYVTNSQQLEEDVVGCKVLHFINNENQEALGYKTLRCKDAVTSSERIMNQVTFCMCSPYIVTFKISLKYIQGCEKRNPTHTCQLGPKIRFENSDFVDLDRFNFCRVSFLNLDGYCFYRGICRDLMNKFSSLIYWSNLHDFNT